jgi:hypothetical protein
VSGPGRADDDAEIRNLLARYCILLDHDDVDSWVGLFTTDAVYEVFGRRWEGEAGLRKMIGLAPGGLHMAGSAVVEIDGDRAHTQQNSLFVDPASGEMRSAVYDDELVRTSDGWRIHRRRCRFITPNGLADRPS